MGKNELDNDDDIFIKTLFNKLLEFVDKENNILLEMSNNSIKNNRNLRICEDILNSLKNWLCNLFKRTQSISHIKSREFVLKDFSKPRVHLINSLKAHNVNRFKAGLLLLKSNMNEAAEDNDKYDLPVEPINVFSDNYNEVSTVNLNIIYKLNYTLDVATDDKRYRIKSSQLKYFIKDELGFAFDIVPYISSLVDPKSRLIFTHNKVPTNRIYRDEMLYLSYAGILYYKNLIKTPQYIEWAFSRIPVLKEMRPKEKYNLINIMLWVLEGMKRIVAFDLAKLKKLNEKYKNTMGENDAQRSIRRTMEEKKCAALDIFFRTLPDYIGTMIGEYNKRSEPSSADCVSCMKQWIDFGNAWNKEIKDIFGESVIEWEENLTYAQRDIEKLGGILE